MVCATNTSNLSGTKAVDGEAQNSVPTVISSLTDNINSKIEAEKNEYLYVGQKLFEGTTKGKELSQGSTLADTTNGFETGISNIVTMKNDITQVFSDMTKYFYLTTNYFQYLSIMFILILALTVIVAFGTQLVICFRVQNKCHATACLTKTFVAILGLLTFALTVVIGVRVVKFCHGWGM